LQAFLATNTPLSSKAKQLLLPTELWNPAPTMIRCTSTISLLILRLAQSLQACKKARSMCALPTQIGPGTRVRLSYVLFDMDGDVIEACQGDQSLSYIHGYGQILPGLEPALDGMMSGQRKVIEIPAELAYGPHDPEGIFEVERSEFSELEPIQVGEEHRVESDDGDSYWLRILEMNEESVVVDSNHPLSGQDLRFEVFIDEVEPATDEELAQAEQELIGAQAEPGCTPTAPASESLVQLRRRA
jgi:FKBP-type peptidyl-prolyl cis-trans isomerase SlyD